MSARRTLDSILKEYNVTRSDVEVDGQYVTIFVSGNRNERITPPTNGDLWALETDDGTFTTNDKEGKFFRFAAVNEEGTRFMGKDELCEYFKERANRAEQETDAAMKTVTTLVNSTDIFKGDRSMLIHILDELNDRIADDTSFFIVDYVEPKPLFKSMIIHAKLSKSRSIGDIQEQYHCGPERCVDHQDYVEVTLTNVFRIPDMKDPWVAEMADDTWVTNDYRHTVFKYMVSGEHPPFFINQDELVAQLKEMIGNRTPLLGTDEKVAELNEELNQEHPDMDLIIDTVNEFGDDLFDGIMISDILDFA